MSQEMRENTQSLDAFKYKMYKVPVREGCLGSLVVAGRRCFREIDRETVFGNKFMELDTVVSDLFAKVESLFSKYYTEAGELADLVRAVFMDRFRGKCFVFQSHRDHFKTRITTVVEVLIHHLRYWLRVLEKNGWKGKTWTEQLNFVSDLKSLVDSLPERVEETFEVRSRENNEEGTKKVTRYVEPFVRNMETTIREALQAQREAGPVDRSNQKQRPQQNRRPRSNGWTQVGRRNTRQQKTEEPNQQNEQNEQNDQNDQNE